MTGAVFTMVLLGALLSAVWNSIVKSGSDKDLHAVLVATSAALIAIVVLPFLPRPARESWSYLAASAVLQVVYYKLLAAAFRSGDMSHAFPIMRGTAPLLVSLASGPLIGEALAPGKWVGVILISGGVMGLAWDARSHANANSAVVRYGLSNALVIAAYTLCDGVGVRESGSAAGYTACNLLLSALILLLWTLATRRAALIAYARGRLPLAFIGGLASVMSYGIVLWAMTRAPIAAVAALRETSMIFVLIIAVLIFKERAGVRRYAATVLIACGAAAIRLL